jgi:hypothetical protein
MDADLSPLINRTGLLPGESLASLFERLAGLNHLDSSYTLYQVCHERLERIGLHDREIWCPTHPETFQVVSGLTSIDELELYRATIHRFASVITAPDQEFEYLTLAGATLVPVASKQAVSKQLLTTRATKYCPLCLQDEPHHKIAWDAVAINDCLHHACILIRRCPSCSRHLSVKSIVRARCSSCGADLRDANPVSLEGDAFGNLAQREIYSWIMNAEGSTGQFRVPGVDLRPRVLYRFIDGICATLITRNLGDYMHKVGGAPVDPEKAKVKAKRRILPADLYGLYATAMKALRDWPESFFEFLDAFAAHRPRARSTGLHVEFGSLYKHWISKRWDGPEFAFVQDAFIEYLERREKLYRARGRANRYQRDSSVTDQFLSQAIPLREAARELGINRSNVKQLVRDGTLRPHGEWSDGPGWHKLVMKQDVFELKTKSEALQSVEQAASRLGVTVNFMRTLGKSRLIGTYEGPHRLGRRGILFTPDEVDRFRRSVASASEPVAHNDRDLVDLFHAARILTVVGVDSVGILELTSRGEIEGWLLDGHPTISGLRFSTTELWEYVRRFRKERDFLTRLDVAERLNVGMKQVSRWISEGKLKADVTCGATLYFHRNQLEGLLRKSK